MRLLRRPRSILFWLQLLVAIVILPGWAVTAVMIGMSYERERATVQANAIGTARALVQAVDRQLDSTLAAGRALATSPYLASADLAGFYRQANEGLSTVPGDNIVLSDAAGQQLLNTFRPFGEALPRHGNLEQLRRVFETGQPVISDLFIGGVTRRPVVAIDVPVIRDGRVAYDLSIGIVPARLAGVLGRQSFPAGWVVSIFDSRGVIVARTEAPETFVGQPGSPGLLRRLQDVAEGALEVDTLEGIPVIATFSRSTTSGWTVAIGIPRAKLTGQLQASLWESVAAAGALFLLGLLLARAFSLRIARSIRSLSAPALAVAAGAPVSAPDTEVAEVNEVGRSLAKAAGLLAERTAARETAERAEREMALAKQAAERSNQAKSQFLAMMSHELRTPLHGVLGFAQLIDGKYYGPLTDKQKEFVDAILFSGHHLLELINDVLELSKIEAGQMTVSIERVDVTPVLKSIVATLRQTAEKAGIALRAGDFGAALPPVRADRVRLAQCLLNLGTNAIKYNRPEGTVTFSYGVVQGQVRISVTDTGQGIPPERQAELFEPFNRLGAERTGIEGTGVGLTLTRRLVDLMGGRIGFVSTPGQGSCFWIDLPPHAAAPAATPAPAGAAPAAPQVSHAAILYVEDNPSNLLLMRNLIATLPGVRLIEAANGEAGLAAAGRQRPDVVIVDINLPDMNGAELLGRLKALPGLTRTPVLALSATALPADIRRGLEAGFFAYLTKPLEVNDFLTVVEMALSERTAGAPAPAE